MSPVVLGALNEGWAQIALALFTTFTSSGIVACALCAVHLLTGSREDDARMRAGRFLIVPLGAVIFGLIASTNHLGRPSNTLYVLSGVGRSPLSNEVVAVVVFTGLVWIAWLASFGGSKGRVLMKALLALSLPVAVAALAFMANAYSIDAIVTWALPYTPINLLLTSFAGGSMLALCALVAAKDARPRSIVALMILCVAATVAGVVVQTMQYLALDSVTSGLQRASDLVPFYPLCIGSFAILVLGAQIIGAVRLREQRSLRTPQAVLMTIMVLAGTFVVRFAFYCMHLTAGF